MRRKSFCALALATLVLFGASVAASEKEVFVGEGVRLGLFAGTTYTIFDCEACWVRHGFIDERFPGLLQEIKDELGANNAVLGGGEYFTLEIDGIPIHLHKQVVTVPLAGVGKRGSTLQTVSWYIQFWPYEFLPGEYVLRAEWGSRNPNSTLSMSPSIPLVTYTTLIVVAAEDQFLGQWINEDPNTDGITRVEIEPGSLHMWGSCTPTDCDWGTTPYVLACPNLTATWNPAFAVRTQQLTLLPDGRLQVDTHTHFTDGSGRPDYDMTEFFVRL